MSKSNVPRGTCAVEKYLYFYFPGNNYNKKNIIFCSTCDVSRGT